MMVELPNVKGNEQKTLYIIGNGFDLAHGILSKYKHFWCWLNLNGYEDYATALQRVFPKLDGRLECLWSNFESALKDYDLHKMYGRYVTLPKDNWNDEEWARNIQTGIEKVKDLANDLPSLLKKWATLIPIKSEPIFSNISPKSKFLTFNYTTTLEQLYHVTDKKNICHIHESVDSGETLITGHDYKRSTDNLPADSLEEERAQVGFIKIMNGLTKPKRQQIEKYRFFFDSLREVNTIIEIGHSLASVDLFYFEEVLKSVAKDAVWHFSVYSESDRSKMNLFVQPARLTSERIKYDTFSNR